jgi:hypothetical protein
VLCCTALFRLNINNLPLLSRGVLGTHCYACSIARKSEIRTACGTQYSESALASVHCVIYEQERQYVPPADRPGPRRGRGRGIVCAGDILTMTTDRKWLSFMRSYPNFIPLSAHAVEHIGAVLKRFAFESIYGHYFDRVIANDAKTVLERSVAC